MSPVHSQTVLAKVQHVKIGEPVDDFVNLNVQYGFVGKFRGPLSDYCWAKQVHGRDIVMTDNLNACGEADGLCTAKDGLNLAVVTADCLPVLMVDKNRRWIMAVHAGWRGLTLGILDNAVDIFLKNGVASEDLRVLIGPHVKGENYPVGKDVIDAVGKMPVMQNPSCMGVCLEDLSAQPDKARLHLWRAAALGLCAKGVSPEHIAVVDVCTAANSKTWSSYRQDGKNSGRNLSWIRK